MTTPTEQPSVLASWLAVLDAGDVAVPADERTMVRHALDRLASEAGPAAARAVPEHVVRVLAASTFLRRFLQRHPEAVVELGELPAVRDRAGWLTWLAPQLSAVEDDAALGRALRIARHRAMLQLTARELISGDPLATGADLAAFAAAILEVTLDAVARSLRPTYGVPRTASGEVCTPVVIGMGKLGGAELNYSSDIDVIFAYATDAGETDGAGGLGRRVDLHTYFSRLFAQVAQALSQQTDEGFVFRVDLDLRPEGRTGPICNSLEGLERYYESFGHAWERLAWIKARPVAGDLALGERIIAALAPFVFRKHLDYAFADEVAAMKGRIDALGARLGRQDGFNVKLGRGGIREVEFAVQTLQLTWGGKLPELRATDTRTALARLALAGLIESAEADALLGAYRLLRRVEHALQLADDRQTHLLPGDPGSRKRVAALAGFELDDGGLAAFEQALAQHRRQVRAAFEAVVAGAAPEHATPAWTQAFAVAIDPDVADPAREDALRELGFLQAPLSRRRLDALVRRPDSPFHPRAIARGGALARKIVQAVAATADPDAAFGHMETLLRTLRHRKAALDQLEQDPRRLRTLTALFGTSHFLSRLLVRSPGLLDRLVFDGSEPAVRTAAEMAAALTAEPRVDGDWEDVLGAVRRFHQAEILRIGFFDLAGLIDTASVGRQLSDLADVILAKVLAAAAETLDEPDAAAGIGVIAMGKLAGRELGYSSDLDLVFVHAPAADSVAVTRLARRCITGLVCATPEGTLYEIDTRLRPSGTQGPLCVTAERLLGYHRGLEAAVWEKQAVLRSRAVLGGPPVEALVATLRSDAMGALAGDPAAAGAVDAMRRRLLAVAGPFDLKLGLGGLIEVEFLVQYLQLTLDGDALDLARSGHAAGSRNAAEALRGLGELGRLDAARAAACGEAYAFVRQLENRMRLVQDRPGAVQALLAADAPADGAAHAASDVAHLRLARRMGYGEGPGARAEDTLQADLRRHRATIADCYSQTLRSTRND
ncbi:MAG: bifunctional [glutamate--ammonia ligase]-adenylyl-L-tyrosine phosphorylase/[glutamate--ammonia-ligase] adenylyltransferase [Deltaproteobacteria bacterium HGW-Deltaproteobacteria-14]|jgi:glutamate-ammonia-ligase adenylyltransferase|nr:MAG: bifunctional [glutamate--ammonia ligase]-adenylyl-L-tyrosine phosphorylase/[glutamate--ammonia-ligase] adenylyltransferase [Deltaproteobacteria bacterium HGW-Deltaproteobacteria-14]